MTHKIKGFIKNLREKVSIYHFLISGFLILIFIISIFIFRNIVRKNILESLVKASDDISERSETFSDYALEINKNMCLFIYNDYNVTELRNMEEFNLSKSSILLRNINNIITSSNYIDSVYIYNDNLDYIFSTSREGNRPEKFFDQEAVSLFMNKERVHNLAPVLRDFNISTASTINQIYSFTIYDENTAVMVNVSPLIYNGLFSIENTSSPSYIIDDDLNVITSSNKSKKININNDILNKLKNRINNNETSGYIINNSISFNSPVLIFSKITNNNWYYLIIDNYGSLFPSSISFERISNTIIFIFSTLLILMIVLFVLPYYRIQRSISRIDSSEIDINTNILHEKLNRLIELSLDSKRMNKSISSMMREEILKSYIYGVNQDERIEDTINEYDIRLNHLNKIRLLLINNGTRNKEYKDIARNYSTNVEGVLLGGNHVLLIIQDSDEELFINIVNDIHNKYGKQRQIVLSDSIYFSDINKTYEGMRKLSLLFALKDDLNFINCRNIKEINNLSKEELHNKARAIINILKEGKINEAISAYEEYMSYINEDSDNNLRIIRYLRNHLEENLNDNTKFSSEDIDRWIISMENRSNIDNYFFDLFNTIALKSADEKRSKALKISNEVIKILKEKYKDPNISAQSIADELDLSYAYCSRVFKQINNKSISSYLNDLRLEEACNLLKEKDIQIKDISSLVGFENHQYFFVLFKNKYGETPRNYHLRYTNA